MPRFLFVFFSFAFYACANNKAEQVTPAPLAPKYYFYPKANLYFDTVNKDYVFQAGDGNWILQKQIPAAIQVMMDKMVLLDTFSQPVWKDNDNHKLVYSALLYATPNDTVEKKEVVVQKPVNTDTVKKEKKGLAKFFDKLFGRKKKDKEEKN